MTFRRTAATALLILALHTSANAQLASWGDYVQRRSKPPVVFVTGHDAVCPDPRTGELPFFNLTFGDFDKVMARDGRVSFVFEACYAPGHPPLEEVAKVFARLLAPLTYEDGEPVREVDVVAHSMGGLIVRTYLAGRQPGGAFAPPAAPRVRKVVFLATPHFGTSVAPSTATDPQLREMSPGSSFLFDLATWNQGADDLRGAEPLAIAGTGGRNGPATDSVVNVASASVDFVMPGRTAVLPMCHTQGGIGQLFLCDAAPGVARVNTEDHPTAKIVLAFLNDDESWRSAVRPAPAPGATSGILVRSRTATDLPRAVTSATFVHDTAGATRLDISLDGLAYGESLPSGSGTLTVDGTIRRIALPAGGSRALVVKPGPYVEAVEPVSGRAWPLALAPGMQVTVKGMELNGGAVELTVAGRTLSILAASPTSLTTVLPEDITGAAELRVRNVAGEHAVRIWLDEASPGLIIRDGIVAALHGSTGRPVSADDAAAPGEVISLFLTGVGATADSGSGRRIALRQPDVTVGGRPCEVLYAGRAPGLAGIDQINCRLAADLLQTGGTVRVQVGSATHTSSADLPVR